MKYPRGLIIAILIGITLFSLTPQSHVKADGEGWLTGWNHRRAVSITGYTNGTLTDYQIDFTVLNTVNILDYTTFLGANGGTNPVIDVGASGKWDDTFIRELGNILYEPDDTGEEYKMFYSAGGDSYNGTNVYVGYAYSSDGKTWTKAGKIIDRALEDPYVVNVGGTYYLYAEDKQDIPFRNIRMYESHNLSTWIDEGDVLDIGTGWESVDVSSPLVWVEGDTWYMLYEGRGADNMGHIGLATSEDGESWTKSGSNPVFEGSGVEGTFDSDEVVPDDLIEIGSTYYMTYHGYGSVDGVDDWRSGLATSTNLTGWTRPSASLNDQADDTDRIYTAMMLEDMSGYIFYIDTNDNDIKRLYPNNTRNMISLDTTDVQDDFDDIRFTASDGETELHYNKSSYSSGEYANFTVNVSSIAANPSTTVIYLYYGNPEVADGSDINVTSLRNQGHGFKDMKLPPWVFALLAYGIAAVIAACVAVIVKVIARVVQREKGDTRSEN
jgi:predicted GH43/DUF377 family glycosyl hydrolase